LDASIGEAARSQAESRGVSTRWVLVRDDHHHMDQERTMEEILRDIREIYAHEEKAAARDREKVPVARAKPKEWTEAEERRLKALIHRKVDTEDIAKELGHRQSTDIIGPARLVWFVFNKRPMHRNNWLP